MILNAMDNFPEQISLVEISLEALGKYLHEKIVYLVGKGNYVKKKRLESNKAVT